MLPLFQIGAQVLGGLKLIKLLSPMVVPFIYMAFILHFFPPCLSLSCQPVKCGNIDIGYPFYMNGSPTECKGKFPIGCDASAPVIQFMGVNYSVWSISYPDQVISIQDPALNNFLFNKQCSFLYNFFTPIPNFNVSSLRPILYANNPFNCTTEDYNSFISLFCMTYNYSLCRDYSLYFWDGQDLPLNCLSSGGNLFEWILSFREENESLSFSLLSCGFSHLLQLRKECFNCQLEGTNCSGNVTTVEHTCRQKEVSAATRSKKTPKIIAAGSAAGIGFLVACLSLAHYLYKHRKATNSVIFRKKNLNNNKEIEVLLEEYGSVTPKRYSYSNVKKITKVFQEKLGQGGYGTVYKGTLSNGHVVAVKILNDSKGDGEEFINEVASICRTSHVNVVSLVGFCHEGSKRALIYDFMCNGSLEKLLYSEKPKTTRDWQQLYEITIGIARGLEYLHRGCNTRIVHFDIKPQNILLDQNFCPKISDFGLAKLCLKKESKISIAGARGTIGYIAPEVFSRNFGVVSSKSDVYSYGMMVLEIVGGRKNPSEGVENSSEAYFPHWIYARLNENGNLLTSGVADESEETVRKMVLVGLWCIQTMPENRPSMSRVIEMMEGSVDDLQIPPKPYLSSSPFGSIIGTSSVQDIRWIDCSSSADS